MTEKDLSNTIYDETAFNEAMLKLQDLLKSGRFVGTGTRRDGIKGDIEAAFGWHAGEPGQPITDPSISDEMRGKWLNELIPTEDEIAKIAGLDENTMQGHPQSSPREIIRWMKNKRHELLGEEPSPDEIAERKRLAQENLQLLIDNS